MKMREDLFDYRGFGDGGDDFELPAALGAGFEIDLEDAFEELSPSHSTILGERTFVLGVICVGVWAWMGTFGCGGGHDLRTMLIVGG
jgi:hypothetical protein